MQSRAAVEALCRSLAGTSAARATWRRAQCLTPVLMTHAQRFKATSASQTGRKTRGDVTGLATRRMTSPRPEEPGQCTVVESSAKMAAASTRSAHSSPTESLSMEDEKPLQSRGGSPSAHTTAPPLSESFSTVKPFSQMPRAFSLPVIGTLWMSMPGGPLHGLTFEEKTKKLEEMYGPIFLETIFMGYSIVHVYKPEDMEMVYRMQGSQPSRQGFRMLQKYYNEFNKGVQGLLTSQGEEWHKLRSKAQVKMMKPKSASAYLHMHNAVAEDFVASIDRLKDEDGIIDDLMPELFKFSTEGIGCVCFNRRLGILAEDIPADSDCFKFIQSVDAVMKACQKELELIFLHRYQRDFRKLIHAHHFIRQLSMQEAKRTLDEFADNARDVDGESGDLIPYLMTKTSLNEDEVMTLVTEFFFAGVDTTSHFLGFALYCLSKNPESQEKLFEEIDRLVPEDGNITANILGRMSYLKAVTKEVFRITPVAPGNSRSLDKDVVVSGYHVPAGQPFALHHDWAGKSAKYVKDPDRFLPERWLRDNTSSLADIHAFILLPFGFGSRSCVGRRFAEQEFSLALIKILKKYHVEYAFDKDLKYTMCMINKPVTPLRFRFVPRK